MTGIATKAKVGVAGCAIAFAASLTSIAPAQAAPAPAPAPAAPVVFGAADAPQGPWWWITPNESRSPDLLRSFRPFQGISSGFIFSKIFRFGCYGKNI